MKKIRTLILEDIKRSGLTPEDGVRMFLRPVTPEEMSKLFKGAHVPAYEIPHFNLDGSLMGYVRYRLLEPFTPKGEKKAAKYLQLPGTKPHFYLPPFCDWKAIASDPKIEIIFVEGEKKSSALAKLGYAAIGLGGIWSWRNKEDDETSDLISDFNLFDWKNRKTTIAFDSDV